MKFAAPVTIVAVLSGAYAMVVQRSSSLPGAIDGVTRSVVSMDTVVKSSKCDASALVKAAEEVVAGIQNGQATADGVSSIGLMGAIGLLQPVQNLKTCATTLLRDVKQCAAAVAKARQCRKTQATMHSLNAHGRRMIDTILKKISSSMARKVAIPYTNNVKKMLAEAEALFAEGRCNDY